MARLYEEVEGPKSPKPEEWYRAAIKLAKDDLVLRQVVFGWALDKGKLAFAKEQAEAALKIEASDKSRYGGSGVGHMLRGVVALWEKDWVEAERDFKALIDDNPNDFGAKNNMALALVEQDDDAKKMKALRYAEGNYQRQQQEPRRLVDLGLGTLPAR